MEAFERSPSSSMVVKMGVAAALVYVTWWSWFGYRRQPERPDHPRWLPTMHEQDVEFVPLPRLDPKRRELTTRFGATDHVATRVDANVFVSDSGYTLRQSLM